MTRKKPAKNGVAQFHLRLPAKLLGKIAEKALSDRRSLNATIVLMLEAQCEP